MLVVPREELNTRRDENGEFTRHSAAQPTGNCWAGDAIISVLEGGVQRRLDLKYRSPRLGAKHASAQQRQS